MPLLPSLGKCIDLYLMDGTATGRWQATLSNWNCIAYKIPRDVLRNCDDLPELHAPGVYFLFGRDDESNRQFVYVGEGDDVLKRLMQPHGFEKSYTFWVEAIVLVTPDNTLDKGKIKYLENRFYGIISDAKRYIVKNANTPTQSQLPKKTRDLLEEFIINTQLLMPALGHKALEPKPSYDTDRTKDNLLYFSRSHGKGGKATGKLEDDGFWVLKGSYIYPEVADYLPIGVKKARAQHAAIIDKDSILQEDISFGSPSYASSFVCGKNSNGLIEWKNASGVPLKEMTEDVSTNKKTLAPKGQTPSVSADGGVVLHLAGKKAVAHGYVSGDEFVVLKGSQMHSKERASCGEWIRIQRKELIDTGMIKNYIFIRDTSFTSPSAAAACIVGGESNGQIMWLNENGVKLKDL